MGFNSRRAGVALRGAAHLLHQQLRERAVVALRHGVAAVPGAGWAAGGRAGGGLESMGSLLLKRVDHQRCVQGAKQALAGERAGCRGGAARVRGDRWQAAA